MPEQVVEKNGWQLLDQILSFYGFIDHGRVFVRNKQLGEGDRELSGVGGGMKINVSRWTPNYPMVTFNISVGFPIGGSFDPSDGSSHTLYLDGVVLF